MRVLMIIGRELLTQSRVLFRTHRYLLANLAVMIGFGYLFVPIDIIPDRIPVIGHLDEATFVLGGFVLARAFADPSSEVGEHPVQNRRAPNGDLTPLLFRLLGYRGWWLIRKPFGPSRSDITGLVVVGGAPRSGTTMFRTLLGRHPSVVSGPETTVFLRRITAPRHLGPRLRLSPRLIERWQIESRSQIEFIERFREAVIADPQRPIWVEKTPANVFHFGFIAHAFPNARLVHVIRDGRDAVCSLRQQPWAKIPRTIMRDSPEAARRCGLIWAASVRAGIAHRHNPQYWELRYEDLVTEPEQALRALMAFLELPWSERLLQTGAPSGRIYSPDWPADIRRTFTNDAREAAGALHDDSIGRWRAELSVADRRVLGSVIAGLLIQLGYERDDGWTESASASGKELLLDQDSARHVQHLLQFGPEFTDLIAQENPVAAHLG